MAARKPDTDAPTAEDLNELNARIAAEAAAATTAEARGGDPATGEGLAGVTTGDVS